MCPNSHVCQSKDQTKTSKELHVDLDDNGVAQMKAKVWNQF